MGIRAAPSNGRWLMERINCELLDRWRDRNPPGNHALILGDDSDQIAPSLRAQGVECIKADISGGWADIRCEEDRLPFEDGSFDCIFASGTLDTVNDLPGALLLIARCLKPGGLFLGAFLGAGSGSYLRAALLAEQSTTQRVARVHPLIDVRAAGDLLARAGFADPVADTETISVRYRTSITALADRRANGLGNALKERQMLTSSEAALFRRHLSASSSIEAGFLEDYCPVYLTALAPALRKF